MSTFTSTYNALSAKFKHEINSIDLRNGARERYLFAKYSLLSLRTPRISSSRASWSRNSSSRWKRIRIPAQHHAERSHDANIYVYMWINEKPSQGMHSLTSHASEKRPEEADTKKQRRKRVRNMHCERGRENFRHSAGEGKWRMKSVYTFTMAKRRATDDEVAEKMRGGKWKQP